MLPPRSLDQSCPRYPRCRKPSRRVAPRRRVLFSRSAPRRSARASPRLLIGRSRSLRLRWLRTFSRATWTSHVDIVRLVRVIAEARSFSPLRSETTAKSRLVAALLLRRCLPRRTRGRPRARVGSASNTGAVRPADEIGAE